MTSLVLFFFAQTRVITLNQALDTAMRQQPQLRQAHANTEAALARADEARAPLLPQLTGSASYQRTTSNFVLRPGSLPSSFNTAAGSSFATGNFFQFSLSASQTIWDGTGQLARWGASRVTADSIAATERATRLGVSLTVRTSYFSARANKALVEVAKETLANQDRHLAQIEGFVKVGTRPEIDLAQARTDRANARVQLINAENNYEVAKAQLNQAMGIEASTDYDVNDESIGQLDAEGRTTDVLLDEALRDRPEFLSLDKQIKAQELTVWAAKTAYGPSLSASTQLTDAGAQLDSSLGWNWSLTLTLNWNLFSGLQTWSTVKEAKANYAGLVAQRDQVRQQTRLEVEQARLAVRAAKESALAAEDALLNARERLRLAEGRYQAGVGNVIELGDAQVALTNAAAQKVQADYNVSSARASLMKALGRF